MKATVWMGLALVACKKDGGIPNFKADPVRAADAVFERYLASTGGLEASQAIRNLRIEAVSEVPAQGLSMTLLILEERPDRSRIETTLPMIGEVRTGFADGIAWETNPLTGPRIKEGREAEEARWSGRLDLYEDFRASWPERKVVGVEQFAGTSCHVLEVVSALGKAETMYYATDDGRWMGTKSKVTTDMGELPMVNEVLEYTELDGVRVPSLTRQLMGPVEVTTRFVAMDANLDAFPDLTPPPEILDLAGR
jgi:hypothetical protein